MRVHFFRVAPSTRELIVDASRRLMQARGYSAVSYADVALEVGIRSASIHHHFPAKADLGQALAEDYNATFTTELAALEGDAAERLRGYLRILGAALQDDQRLCLCTMFAAEYSVLPPGVRAAVQDFATINERWLTELLTAGAADASLAQVEDPAGAAMLVFSEAQGAQLVARCLGDAARYAVITDLLMQRWVARR